MEHHALKEKASALAALDRAAGTRRRRRRRRCSAVPLESKTIVSVLALPPGLQPGVDLAELGVHAGARDRSRRRSHDAGRRSSRIAR